MRRRRVLTVVDSLRRGGVERLVVTLQGRLSRSRFDLRVASLSPPDDLAAELRGMKVSVYELEHAGARDLPRTVLRLRRLVSGMGIDLVHTHGAVAGVVGRLASWGKAPVVSTLHDPAEPRDHAGVGGRALAALDRLTARRLSARLLAVSHASRDAHARLGYGEPEVVHNCIEVEGFRARVQRHDRGQVRRAHGLGGDETVLLHVGRFERHKGQDQLLRAFRIALTEDPGLRLLLAGKGPTLPEARGLAEELDLQDAVVFLGEVADPAPLYRAADVFVFPSRREAFGVALLEAMAAGLPAVVARTGGIPEVASDGTALFADCAREEDLARRILELVRDPGLRRRLGEAAARRASDFDVSRCVTRLEEIYRELT